MTNRADRFPANFSVIMRKGPDMYPATLCNISPTGGCIVGNYKMAKGDSTVMDYKVGQTRATVMWSTGNMSGLRFDSPMSTYGLNCIRALKDEAPKAG